MQEISYGSKKYWRIHKIVARIDALEGLSALREDIQAEWEKLDHNILGRAMIIGEKAVRKPMGKHSWSKQLRKAAYHHQYCKRRCKMHEYGIEEDEVMEELRLTAGILPTEICIGCSREKLLSKCTTSKTQLRDVQKQSISIRRRELEEELEHLEGYS